VFKTNMAFTKAYNCEFKRCIFTFNRVGEARMPELGIREVDVLEGIAAWKVELLLKKCSSASDKVVIWRTIPRLPNPATPR